MSWWTKVTAIALASRLVVAPVAASQLEEHAWSHGSADCDGSRNPPIEIVQFDARTYILRQDKCLHFEAPFMYLLLGEDAALLLDTGAAADPARFPLFDTIRRLVESAAARRGKAVTPLLVLHTHSHADHTAADPQFRDRRDVTLVEPTSEAVRAYFGFDRWPEGMADVELGGRRLSVLPAPGHQAEGIVLYDPSTQWLLTGDTLYPGRLTVLDWEAYRATAKRVLDFSRNHPISAVMGSHIELSRVTGALFPPGATYQPGEAALPLPFTELQRWAEAMQAAGEEPATTVMESFTVAPVGAFARGLGTFLKWIGVR